MTINRRLLHWGLFFVTTGAVVLAITGGLVTADGIATAFRLWPVLVIALGVGVLLRRTRLNAAGGIVLAVVPGLVLGGVLGATSLVRLPDWDELRAACVDARPAGLETRRGTFTGDATVDLELAVRRADGDDRAGRRLAPPGGRRSRPKPGRRGRRRRARGRVVVGPRLALARLRRRRLAPRPSRRPPPRPDHRDRRREGHVRSRRRDPRRSPARRERRRGDRRPGRGDGRGPLAPRQWRRNLGHAARDRRPRGRHRRSTPARSASAPPTASACGSARTARSPRSARPGSSASATPGRPPAMQPQSTTRT